MWRMFSDQTSSDANMNYGEPWCSENPMAMWFANRSPRSADGDQPLQVGEATRILSGIGSAVAWHLLVACTLRRDQQAHKWVLQERWQHQLCCRMVSWGRQKVISANLVLVICFARMRLRAGTWPSGRMQHLSAPAKTVPARW